MKLELVEDGLEKVETNIQEIETLATNGIFSENGSTQRFHNIVSEVKKLRQTLREIVLITPADTPTEAA